MSRASRSRLQSRRVEALSREPQEGPETLPSLGRTLPVTVRLPKKTLTPGALEPRAPGHGRRGKQPVIEDIDNELCA